MKVTFAGLLASACALVAGCYVQGSGCAGPLCVGVASGSCHSGINCDETQASRDANCPAADSIRVIAERTLRSARIDAGGCAGESYPAAPELVWSQLVFNAANLHALDMASNNFLSRIGSDGLDVSARLEQAGVDARASAQLVSAGAGQTPEVLDGWLSQRLGCGQLLDRAYDRFALACRADFESDEGAYWSLVLAAGR